jgi:plasmid stabilization system protein ParE
VSRSTHLSEAAQEHLDGATAWYSIEAPHQVDRFIAEVLTVRRRIAAFPHLGHSTETG